MLSLRKLIFATTLTAVAAAGSAQTSESLTRLWKTQADDPASTYILSTGDAARGMYLNKTLATGGSLLVASRANGNFIRRIDPATGALKDPAVLPNSAYLGTNATFIISKIVVSESGKIFVFSLGVGGAAEQHFRIYRHADEFSEGVLVYDIRTDTTAGVGRRIADDADIIGPDNNLKIIATGQTTGGGVLFTSTDGGLTWSHSVITGMTAFTAQPAIAWDPDVANRFWLRTAAAAGGDVFHAMDLSGAVATVPGGVGNLLPDNSVVTQNGYGPIDVGMFNGVKVGILGIGASSATTVGKAVNVYRLSDLVPLYYGVGSAFEPGGAKANGNAAGDVYLDSANNEIYVLYTNNSVTKWGLPVTSVSDWNLY